ncbi:PRELI-like family protein, partial [Ancylostoma duodenale]
HDWETVVNAAWRKYPNPMNQGVTGMDVLRQTLQAGKILSERIIQSHFHIPSWATKRKSKLPSEEAQDYGTAPLIL